MRSFATTLAVAIFVTLMPTMASAQASLTGVVRDASGAVLPGVTVEAASPALIEKVRTTVTNDTGQYRIENLKPGTYSVTFTLAGFSTVIREGIELQGSFSATINADLRVGTITETITVRGESPIVDVQNTTQQHVLSHEVIDVIPSGRSDKTLATLIPGVSIAGAISQDVGFAWHHRERCQYADRRNQPECLSGSDDRHRRRIGRAADRRRPRELHPEGWRESSVGHVHLRFRQRRDAGQ
jgi:hypothetical protein